ncbi:MAG: hypothetical protein WCW33_02735 [Candidatus Babeliales bacterium]
MAKHSRASILWCAISVSVMSSIHAMPHENYGDFFTEPLESFYSPLLSTPSLNNINDEVDTIIKFINGRYVFKLVNDFVSCDGKQERMLVYQLMLPDFPAINHARLSINIEQKQERFCSCVLGSFDKRILASKVFQPAFSTWSEQVPLSAKLSDIVYNALKQQLTLVLLADGRIDFDCPICSNMVLWQGELWTKDRVELGVFLGCGHIVHMRCAAPVVMAQSDFNMPEAATFFCPWCNKPGTIDDSFFVSFSSTVDTFR